MSRSVIAGQKINLRTRFRDDLTDPALASGVSLYLFEPDTDPLEPSAAYLTIPNPTYISEGIYEYGFNVPDDAEEGEWTDLWYGTLNTQLLSGIFNFEVYSAGEAVELGDQLALNNIIEVTLSSGLMAIDGTYLEDGYELEFMTTISPAYTNIRKVKLEVGGYVNNLPDDTIQTAILEASLEADALSFETVRNTSFYNHVRREWVTCRVSYTLIDNVTSNALRSKSLGDLRVEYDSGAIVKTLGRIIDCLQKWEPQLMAGGYAKDAQQPVGVVKGEYDYDRPVIGRLWSPMDSNLSDSRSASNDRGKDALSRRYEKIFKEKKRFW